MVQKEQPFDETPNVQLDSALVSVQVDHAPLGRLGLDVLASSVVSEHPLSLEASDGCADHFERMLSAVVSCVLFRVLVLNDAPDHLKFVKVFLVLVGHKAKLLHQHNVLGVMDRRLRVSVDSKFLRNSVELDQVLLDQNLSRTVAGSLALLLILLLFLGLAGSAVVLLSLSSAFSVLIQRVVD